MFSKICLLIDYVFNSLRNFITYEKLRKHLIIYDIRDIFCVAFYPTAHFCRSARVLYSNRAWMEAYK